MRFKLRDTNDRLLSNYEVCEILEDGSVVTSTIFDISSSRDDPSCIIPLMEFNHVAIREVALNLDQDIQPGVRRIFVTEGICVNNPIPSPLMSESINVTSKWALPNYPLQS